MTSDAPPLLNGGRTTYGHVLGVLMLDTVFPRPVGDIGNAMTWPFPVLYRVVDGAFQAKVVWDREGDLLDPFLRGARELEREGVRIITTSCGYLAQYQQELAAALTVPVVTSSLVQVPLVSQLLGKGRTVGILTVTDELGERHFRGAGFSTAETPVAVGVLPADSEFVTVHGAFDVPRTTASHERLAQDVLVGARELVATNPGVGALVMECTNMAPYSAMVRAELGIPVFDIHTAVMLTASAFRVGEPWSHSTPWPDGVSR